MRKEESAESASPCQFVFEGRYDPPAPLFLTWTAEVPGSFGSQWNATVKNREDALWASEPFHGPVGQAINLRRYSV
jgi:hypothetical protein